MHSDGKFHPQNIQRIFPFELLLQIFATKQKNIGLLKQIYLLVL